jgi:FkbM family methyltransferase
VRSETDKAKAMNKVIDIIKKGFRTVSILDVGKYYLLSKGTNGLHRVRIKAIGNKQICARAGTEDYMTLYSTFCEKYHLPPRILPKNPVILDLGSNIGATILHFKHLYPSSRIIGVEMDEDNYKLAKTNTGFLGDVELIHGAISCFDGIVSYNKATGEDAYSIISNEKTNGTRSLINVNSITIPSIISKYNLPVVDFIKMDIEGEEIKLFEKHTDLSWLDLVKSLNIEVHGDLSHLQEIVSLLEKSGFRAWKDTHHWSAIMAVR